MPHYEYPVSWVTDLLEFLRETNPCLQCDECRSGPIFQKVAGRTRRGSGIQSAIERPGVLPLVHDYA